MPTTWLTSLSYLVTRNASPSEAVEVALQHLREGLTAQDVFFVYGDTEGFGHYGTSAQLDLESSALWKLHRELSSGSGPRSFSCEDGQLIVSPPELAWCAASSHLGALIPMTGMGEMLIATGSWPNGLGRDALADLEVALPSVTLILARQLDRKRAERQRDHLSALANISRVLSESGDVETVLTSMASTIATATGVDYVTIDLCDANGKVTFRCFNESRPGVEAFRDRWKQGAQRPDEARDTVLKTKRPLLFADAPNDPRLPAVVRQFAQRTLMRSIGTLPLLTKDETLGVVTVASHSPLEFSPQQVELLEGLAAQTATAVQAIHLYQELAASRRQLQRLNEQLQESMSVQHHLARADTLTGIPNRRYLDETLDAECRRASLYGQPLSVVMADLDNLKNVNDRFSHGKGDDVLRHAARIARETCRQADMVGRYGGDEFVFVLPATNIDEAAAFGERFRARLAESPMVFEAQDVAHQTVSLGVAQWDQLTMGSPSDLIDRADRAMYAAKTAGRNRTVVAAGPEAQAA